MRWPAGRLPQRFSDLASKFVLPSRSWTSLLVPLLLSVVFQLIVVYTTFLLCTSFGLTVSYLQLLWVVAIVSLAQALPISIAGLGVREGVYVYLLHQLGVSTSAALALSLMVFAIQVVLAVTGGILQIGSHVKQQPSTAVSEKL